MARTKFKPTEQTKKFAKRLKEIRGKLSLDEMSIKLYGDKFRKDRLWDLEKNRAMPTFAEIQSIKNAFKYPYEYVMGEVDNIERTNIEIGKKYGLTDQTLEYLQRVKICDLKTINLLNDLCGSDAGQHLLKLMEQVLYCEPVCFEYKGETFSDINVQYANADNKIDRTEPLNMYELAEESGFSNLNFWLRKFKEKIINKTLTLRDVSEIDDTNFNDFLLEKYQKKEQDKKNKSKEK